MSAIDNKKMTVDEYLVWAEARPERYELINGAPVAMSPERVRHTKIKARAYLALLEAAKRTQGECLVLMDGATVRVAEHLCYEPDALVCCGEPPSDDDIEVQNPVIIIEVLSPTTRHVDTGSKFTGYFSIKSVRHYLIVDAEREVVIHHYRNEDGEIISTIRSDGALSLDPPGLEVKLRAFFEE